MEDIKLNSPELHVPLICYTNIEGGIIQAELIGWIRCYSFNKLGGESSFKNK